MTLRDTKINILTDLHYSRLLVYVVNGYGTYWELKGIRKAVEGNYIKFPRTMWSSQMKQLNEGVILSEKQQSIPVTKKDNEPRQYNIQKDILIEGCLGILYIEYLKICYNRYSQKKSLSDQSFREHLIEKKDLKIYEEIVNEIDKKYTPSAEYKEKHSPVYILNHCSDSLKLFLHEQIITYLRDEFNINRYNLMAHTFEYHFDRFTQILLKVRDSNDHVYTYRGAVNKQHKELYYFLEVVKEMDGNINDHASKIHYWIDKYIGYPTENVQKKRELNKKI